jgi:hypothetical protein
MKFKALEWKQEMNTREHADLAFGLEADVWNHRDYNNVCVWAIGDSHDTYVKGRCKTREQAKMKAENAFIEYVTTNLQKCTE